MNLGEPSRRTFQEHLEQQPIAMVSTSAQMSRTLILIRKHTNQDQNIWFSHSGRWCIKPLSSMVFFTRCPSLGALPLTPIPVLPSACWFSILIFEIIQIFVLQSHIWNSPRYNRTNPRRRSEAISSEVSSQVCNIRLPRGHPSFMRHRSLYSEGCRIFFQPIVKKKVKFSNIQSVLTRLVLGGQCSCFFPEHCHWVILAIYCNQETSPQKVCLIFETCHASPDIRPKRSHRLLEADFCPAFNSSILTLQPGTQIFISLKILHGGASEWPLWCGKNLIYTVCRVLVKWLCLETCKHRYLSAENIYSEWHIDGIPNSLPSWQKWWSTGHKQNLEKKKNISSFPSYLIWKAEQITHYHLIAFIWIRRLLA